MHREGKGPVVCCICQYLGWGGVIAFLSGFETRIYAFVIYQEGVLGGASLLVYDTGDFYLMTLNYASNLITDYIPSN